MEFCDVSIKGPCEFKIVAFSLLRFEYHVVLYSGDFFSKFGHELFINLHVRPDVAFKLGLFASGRRNAVVRI